MAELLDELLTPPITAASFPHIEPDSSRSRPTWSVSGLDFLAELFLGTGFSLSFGEREVAPSEADLTGGYGSSSNASTCRGRTTLK